MARAHVDIMVDGGDLPFAMVRSDGRVIVRLARRDDQAIALFIPPGRSDYVAELVSQLQMALVGMAEAAS